MIRYNYYQCSKLYIFILHVTRHQHSRYHGLTVLFSRILYSHWFLIILNLVFFMHFRKSDSVKSLGFISNQCIAGNFLPTCPNPPSTREITQHNSKSRKCNQTQTVFTKGVAHCLYWRLYDLLSVKV